MHTIYGALNFKCEMNRKDQYDITWFNMFKLTTIKWEIIDPGFGCYQRKAHFQGIVYISQHLRYNGISGHDWKRPSLTQGFVPCFSSD